MPTCVLYTCAITAFLLTMAWLASTYVGQGIADRTARAFRLSNHNSRKRNLEADLWGFGCEVADAGVGLLILAVVTNNSVIGAWCAHESAVRIAAFACAVLILGLYLFLLAIRHGPYESAWHVYRSAEADRFGDAFWDVVKCTMLCWVLGLATLNLCALLARPGTGV